MYSEGSTSRPVAVNLCSVTHFPTAEANHRREKGRKIRARPSCPRVTAQLMGGRLETAGARATLSARVDCARGSGWRVFEYT